MTNEDKVPFNQVNIMVTSVLSIYIVSGFYSIKEDVIYSYTTISMAVFFLICFSIISIFCIIKIKNKTATSTHMELIRIVPIFGLIYKNSSTYQRMARKLASDEAIQGCKNAVNNMEINYSKDDWNAFSEWFPKIDTKGNLDIRYSLILRALCAKIKYLRKEVGKEMNMKLLNIMRSKAYNEMNIANFLRIELIDEITNERIYTESEVTQEALEKELKNRTSKFDELRENLTTSNIDSTFEEMYKIQN